MGGYWSYPYYRYRRPYAYHYYPYHYAPAYPLWYYVGENDAHHIQNPGNFLTTDEDSERSSQSLMREFIGNVHRYQNTRRLKNARESDLSKIRSEVLYSAELLGKALGQSERSTAVMASHAMLMIDYTDKRTRGNSTQKEMSEIFGDDLERVTELLGEGQGIHSNAWLEYLNCSTKGLGESRKWRIEKQRRAAEACVNLVGFTDSYM